MSDVTTYVNQFDPEQTLRAIAASLKWNPDLPMPTGSSATAKAIRGREAMLRDGEYQNFRVQQKYFSAAGESTTGFTKAEANTLRLKNLVDNMSDERVNKFERIFQSFPNQSPGFYTALVDNDDFDVVHPQFEELAAIDLEENTRQQTRMMPEIIGKSWLEDAMYRYGGEEFVPVPGSYYTGSKQRSKSGLYLPTGDPLADDAGTLPPGYEGEYGAGTLSNVMEGLNQGASGVFGFIDEMGSKILGDAPTWVLRTGFTGMASAGQAIVGAGRSAAGALSEEGGPNFGKAALGIWSATGLGAPIGNAIYGDENFNSAWEQTFLGQMREGGFDTGSGLFPGGKVAELQARKVYETHSLDDQVWSLGVQSAHTLGMDPESSAYHFVSGLVDAVTVVATDPFTYTGGAGVASRALALGGKGVARGVAKAGTEEAIAKAVKIENFTTRGVARKQELRAKYLIQKGDDIRRARAVAAGASPEDATYAQQVFDYAVRARSGEDVSGLATPRLEGDLDAAGMAGMQRAAQDFIAKYESQALPDMDGQVRLSRQEKRLIKRGLADGIKVPEGMTGIEAEYYRAWSTLFENRKLHDFYRDESVRLTDNAANMRRPEKEQQFVNTYIADVGEQLDLAASSKMGDLGADFMADQEMAAGVVQQVTDDLVASHQMDLGDASVALETMIGESRYGPMPESVYTITEPTAGNAFGRVNGEDAVVQFDQAKRVDPGDPVIDEAQRIVTDPAFEVEPARIDEINNELLARLNIDGPALREGFAQPLDVSQDFDYSGMQQQLFDADSQLFEGADLTAALMRLTNTEPKFQYNLAFAADDVPLEVALAARRILLRDAKKAKRTLNATVNKHMKKALKDIDVADLTVEKIREDILQMTDLEKIIEMTLGQVVDGGGVISYGELLRLAGQVGGHGSLADLLAKSKIQGIKALNEDGTGVWWSDRSIIKAGAVDLDDVGRATINPLKHNNPAYFLVGRKLGEPYKALTVAEARKAAQKEQQEGMGRYFLDLKLGIDGAAKARRDYSFVQAKQRELQYHAARAVSRMDIGKLAGEGLPEEIYAFLDGEGIMPSDEIIQQAYDILEEQGRSLAEANDTLMHGVRADMGVLTDWRDGSTPIVDPRMTLVDSKRALNLDNPTRIFTKKAFEKLSKETDIEKLINRTGRKWDKSAIKAVLQNAKKTEIIGPEGIPIKYTDAMRLDDFIRIAASQLGHNMETSVRSIRTAIEPADGAKAAPVRRYLGKKADRWSSFLPNAQEIDLSSFAAVAARILDYGIFHKIDSEAVRESLEMLMGEGNTQQLSRLALENILNKTNDAIIDQFDEVELTESQRASLKQTVRDRTSYSIRRDNELRRTFVQEIADGANRPWNIFNKETGKVEKRMPHSHMYLNEQVNNFIQLPSTADLIGLQRKIEPYRKFIAKSKFIEEKHSAANTVGFLAKALDELYLNVYRTMLLVRLAYIARNVLEMDVRMFLSDSPVSLFSHPVNHISALLGEIAPKDSPLARPNRPFRQALKRRLGTYDQTVFGYDMADYGDDAEIATMNANHGYHVERGRNSMSDERTLQSAMKYRDYARVNVTDNRWVEGLSHQLYSHRTSSVSRLVARDGLSKPQLDFLNYHLAKNGKTLEAPQQTGEMATKLYPVAVLMHEALLDQRGMRQSLREFYNQSREFQPGRAPKVDRLTANDIDQIGLQLDSIRTSGMLDQEEVPTSVLMTDSPQAILDTMLLSDEGYHNRIQQATFGGDQRLKDYIAYGGYHPAAIPIGTAIPEQVKWLTNLKKPNKEIYSLGETIRSHYGSQIGDAKRIYDARERGGVVTEDADRIADMMSKVHVRVRDESWETRNPLNWYADLIFGLSSKVERRGKMGPEYRSYYWGMLGDNVDELSVAALAESEQAAIRTLSPLRRMTKAGPGPEIGRSHKYYEGIKRRQAEVDDYNAAKAEVKVASAEGRQPPAEAVEKMRKYSQGLDLETANTIADQMAFDHVKDLFYDATKKRNLFYSMRYGAMFIAPAMNTLSVWAKLMTENPTQVYKAYRAAYALQQEGTGDVLYGPEEGMNEMQRALHAADPNKAFLFRDETGWQINIPLVGKLGALVPGGVKPGMVGPTSMRLESLNFAMSGGTILPGVSPMVSTSYAAFKGDTDMWIEKKLDRWLLPFGERSVLEEVLPSWLVGLGVGTANKFGKEWGMSDDLLLRNFKPAMAYLYSTGNYPGTMTDMASNTALVEDARALAADMAFWQAVGQAVLPSRPLVDWAAADKSGDTVGIASMSSLFYDDYLVEHQGDYEGAMTQLYDDFGMIGIFAVTGAKENVGKIPSSSGWDWMVANPGLAKDYDKYIYYFFPADEGDMRARLWMEERGLRTQLSVNEQFESVRSHLLTMQKAQVNDQYVNGLIDKDESIELKKRAATRFGDVSEFEQKDIATPQQFPNILDRMLKIPEFRNTPAGTPAAYAMTWRKYYMDLAQETGQSLGTRKNAALKEEYYARLNGILNQTGGQKSEAIEIIDMLKKEF